MNRKALLGVVVTGFMILGLLMLAQWTSRHDQTEIEALQAEEQVR